MRPKLGDWYRSTLGHALLSAVVLWAALPPLDLWPLAWIAPVWWVLLIRGEELPGKRPYGAIWVAGFLFWLAAVYWVCFPHWQYTTFGWAALGFYLAFYLPVFVGVSRVAVHRLRVPVIVAAPVVWTGLELVRGHFLTGFTMASLGHTQYRWIELIQLADLAGAYGVGFVVMFAAACVGRMLPLGNESREYWPLVPLAAILGAAMLYGHLRVSNDRGEPKARIALIQGSIDTVLFPEPGARAEMHQQYYSLTRQAAARYPDLDLIIWPETVFGGVLFDYAPDAPVPDDRDGSESEFHARLEEKAVEHREPMRQMAENLGTSLLLGASTVFYGSEGFHYFNSAVFVPRSGGPIRRYDKMHLVVFGEYVPFAEELSWLVRLTPLNSLNLGVSRGTEPAMFELDGLRIAPNICYETVIPHLIRRQVNTLARSGREPDVLVNLTNDGWFRGSSELDMHLICGVFRAVECRKPLLIAANTGFSASIDADGRIVAKGPRRATGTILAEVGPDGRKSWYLAYGDFPAGICLAACLVFAAVGAWDRFRNPKATRTERRKTNHRGRGRTKPQ